MNQPFDSDAIAKLGWRQGAILDAKLAETACTLRPLARRATYLEIVRNEQLPTCEAERFAAGIELVSQVRINGNDDAAVCAP